ncbi:MAG: hypothetical protein Q8P11_01940 [bacterium]|nr:hypothetical protein [bacterium]
MSSLSFSVRQTLFSMYKKPRYWIITLLISFVYFIVALMIPQWSLISYALHTPLFTLSEKLYIIWHAFGDFTSMGTVLSETFTIVISLLVGINTAFIVYYISLRARFRKRASGAGLIMLILSLFGVGCTACGSVFLSSIFGLTIATSIITVLPFRGLEFSLVSIILLLASISYLAWSSQRPIICKS